MTTKPFVIGIIGETAAGKSMVASMLARLGARGIDADALVHLALQREGPGYYAVITEFGAEILNQEGDIDRATLAGIVFSDTKKLQKLESIIHPQVSRAFLNFLGSSQAGVVTLEAVKLIESGLHQYCDAVWMVRADENIRTERLAERGMPIEEARRRMSHQTPSADLRGFSDREIDNSGTIQDTWRQVHDGWHTLRDISNENQVNFDQADRFVRTACKAFRLVMPDEEPQELKTHMGFLAAKEADFNVSASLITWMVYLSNFAVCFAQFTSFEATFIFLPFEERNTSINCDYEEFIEELKAYAAARFCHTVKIACHSGQVELLAGLVKQGFLVKQMPIEILHGIKMNGYNISTKFIKPKTYMFNGF